MSDEIKPKKRKKERRKPAPSQVCTKCLQSCLRMVAVSGPRVCTECFTWPPTEPPKPKPKPKKERRR